jgi:hypothetical protein
MRSGRAYAVIITTSAAGRARLIRWSTSTPFIPAILMSRKVTSNDSSPTHASACTPFEAMRT